MMPYILMMLNFVVIAWTEDCHLDVDSLPLSKICKSPTNSNGVECVPFEVRPSNGCFETRYYPEAYWVSIKPPVSSLSDEAVIESINSLHGYRSGDNDAGEQLSATYPFVYKFSEDRKLESVDYYIPSRYQDNPPKPDSSKVTLFQSHPREVYVKPISVDDFGIFGSYEVLKEELKSAKIFDFDWKHFFIFAYCELGDSGCRFEVGLTRMPAAPFDKVCNSHSQIYTEECFRGESREVDGTNGLVVERKYPDVSIVLSYVEDGNIESGFNEVGQYVYGKNVEARVVPTKLPFVTFHGMYEGAVYEGAVMILQDGQSAPRPTSHKVLISTYKESKLYVLAFGGRIGNYKETYGAYYQKLCALLDAAQISYNKDLTLTLDYSYPADEYQRHEVAVEALD